MKIYMFTDLEGISGIDDIEMLNSDSPRHGFSIARLMADVNAAVDGAYDGGAAHVTVLDGHGGGGNFDLSLLDKRALLDTRDNGRLLLDESYSGCMCIGYHAMAGTINGFLDHTQDSRKWFNYMVNGRRTGELGQCAMMAAHYNVPVLMVSGDEAACTEARQFLGDIECAAVKRGAGRNHAELTALEEASSRIRTAACRAMSLAGKAKLFKPILPMELKLELYRSDYCDELANKPGVERIDARTVRKVADSYLDFLF